MNIKKQVRVVRGDQQILNILAGVVLNYYLDWITAAEIFTAKEVQHILADPVVGPCNLILPIHVIHDAAVIVSYKKRVLAEAEDVGGAAVDPA